ncbi:hypothetical protein [Actinoplanes subtropicus]|uniref:hypothetical protein n=1 Tax=Actinoplanes subtropicus TaxID=543632 RepID=UPI000A6C0745|nr:hypothetical protein [Actinoplanes subtropicus]
MLLAPRSEPGKATAAALASIERLGWILVSMIEPDRFLDAVRMVIGGLVDLVVVAKPEDLPHILTGPDLAAYATPGAAGGERTRMLRTDVSPRQRRPQFVDRDGLPVGGAEAVERPAEIRRCDTDFKPKTREPLTRSGPAIPPRAAESGANVGSEFGTQVPNREQRPRTSELRRARLFGDFKTGRRRRA